MSLHGRKLAGRRQSTTDDDGEAALALAFHFPNQSFQLFELRFFLPFDIRLLGVPSIGPGKVLIRSQ
ncbi:hypothetical protein GQ457_11G001290 [Hibiscus cannabinus]